MKTNDNRLVKKGQSFYIGNNRYDPAVCSVCGDECLLLFYRIRKELPPYCSNKCRGIAVRGQNSHSWKGGRNKTKDGYISTNYYDSTGKRREKKEHTLIMEKHLGRPLTKDETVHHKNGIRDDNRLENLELWTSRHHKGQRVKDLVEWAKEILALYSHL